MTKKVINVVDKKLIDKLNENIKNMAENKDPEPTKVVVKGFTQDGDYKHDTDEPKYYRDEKGHFCKKPEPKTISDIYEARSTEPTQNKSNLEILADLKRQLEQGDTNHQAYKSTVRTVNPETDIFKKWQTNGPVHERIVKTEKDPTPAKTETVKILDKWNPKGNVTSPVVVQNGDPAVLGPDNQFNWPENFKVSEEIPQDITNARLRTYDGVIKSLFDMYKKKNKDYGDAWYDELKEFGIMPAVIRLYEKVNRLKAVTKNGKAEVIDEKIEDTLMDIANYAIMTIADMKELEKEDDIHF